MSKQVTRWFLSAGFVWLVCPAQAATRVKANNADDLNLTSSWLVAAPGSGDVAQWNSTVTSANSVLLGANLNYQGVSIVNPAGAVTLGGTNTLTIGCQGIDMASATVGLTLTNSVLALLTYSSPYWNVASGRTLTVNPAAFVRPLLSALSVQGSGTVVSATLTNRATGIMGPWAYYGTGTSTKYATVSGGSVVVGYSAGASVAAADVTDTTGTTNYDVTAAGTLGLGAAVNTLRYVGGAGTVGGAFQANGILNAGTGALTATGGVTIGADRELVLVSPDVTRTLTLSGEVADHPDGASSVIVTGGGIVSLTATNTYSGPTAVSMGILSITKDGSLGKTNGNTVIFYTGRVTDGGRLALSGNVTIPEPIMIVGGEISGGGATIYCAASGETNTLSGPITIALSNHARISAGSGTVLNINAPITTSMGNSLVLGPGGGLIYVNAPFTGFNSFYLHGGPGTVILNTNGISFTTAYVQQGNILKLGVNNAFQTNRTLVVGSSTLVNTDAASTSSGIFDLGGKNQTVGSLLGFLNSIGTAVPYTRVITNSVATPSTLTVGSSDASGWYQGVIRDGAGKVSLSKIGTNLLRLGGTNTYSGDTTVYGGTLVVSNTFALQNSTLVCTNSGAVSFSSGLTAFTLGGLAGTRNIALVNEGGASIALTVGGNNSSTVYSGTLSGGGSLTKAGTGTLTLAGTNTYAGTTSVTNGTLALGRDNALHAASRLVVGGGGTLAAGSFSNSLQRLVVTGPATLALGDGSCHLSFADSSEAWTGILELSGTLGSTSLRFGTDASGLTQAQLDSIRVGGKKVWLAMNAEGYLRRVTGSMLSVH